MKYLVFVFIFIFSSCEVTKQSLKNKSSTDKIVNTDTVLDTEKTSKTITERVVEGGEINSTIKPEDERERDENGLLIDLIQEIKDGGLTKTIHYKPDGSVDVDCRLAEMFERIQQENVERDNSIISIMENLEQRLVVKEKEKTESISSSAFIYFFIGMALFVVIVMAVFFKMIKSHLPVL